MIAPNMDHGFGRLPAHDERDARYPLSAAVPVGPIPTYRYWRTGPVLDQGPYPHCVGFAWAGWLQCSPVRTPSGPAQAEAIYREAQTVDEWPGEGYSGTSVRAGAKVLTGQGRVTQYLWATDVETIAEFVLARSPVVLGTNWYQGMSNSLEGIAEPIGVLEGGHAYLVTGYNSRTRLFRCLNSWGLGWGQHGRFWMRYGDLAYLLAQGGEACAAVEQAVV